MTGFEAGVDVRIARNLRDGGEAVRPAKILSGNLLYLGYFVRPRKGSYSGVVQASTKVRIAKSLLLLTEGS